MHIDFPCNRLLLLLEESAYTMRGGTMSDHVSPCIASLTGLRLSDRKLALRQLGPADSVSALFFVSIERGVSREFTYLVNKVPLTTMCLGMRCKIPAFHFNTVMVDYLEKIGVSRYYLESNGVLWPIKGPYVFETLKSYLAIRVSADDSLWFDQDFVHSDVSIRQPYIPSRNKRIKVRWAVT